MSIIDGKGWNDVQLTVPPGSLDSYGGAMGLVASCKLEEHPDVSVNGRTILRDHEYNAGHYLSLCDSHSLVYVNVVLLCTVEEELCFHCDAVCLKLEVQWVLVVFQI